jgi:preprotein translocase subunit SecE
LTKNINSSTIPTSPPEGFFNRGVWEKNKKAMKINEYIKETKAEMAHVTWPTRKQAIAYATLVVVVSVGVSAFLGVFDYIFSRLLTLLF